MVAWYSPGAYSVKQLEMMRRELRKKTLEELTLEYVTALEACKVRSPHIAPNPMAIQNLVQIWKELWRRDEEQSRRQAQR